MIFETLKDALADCPANRFVELRADLDEGIAAMETFIVANAVLPVTVTALRARAAAESARTRAEASAKPRVCTAGDAGAMIAPFDAMGRPARLEMVRESLAVPRWPVSNPCL